jgi:archaellum biogenesis ATPase FlaH
LQPRFRASNNPRFSNKKSQKKGIFISTTKPYEEIIEKFSGTGIDEKKLYMIVKKELLEEINKENIYELNPPISHIELSFAISNQTNIEEYNFLYLDSLNDLMQHYSLDTIEKFIFYLVSSLSYKDINVIITCKGNMPQKTLDRLRNYVNELIIV